MPLINLTFLFLFLFPPKSLSPAPPPPSAEGQKPGSLIVRLGTNKANTPGAGAPDVKVTEIRQHADYNPNTIEHDISLLILANPVSPSTTVRTIELETEDLADGDGVTVYGWGLTDGNAQSTPNDLQKGQLKVVSREKCQAKWGDVNAIAPGMICAIAESTQACNVSGGGGGGAGAELFWGRGQFVNEVTNLRIFLLVFNSGRQRRPPGLRQRQADRRRLLGPEQVPARRVHGRLHAAQVLQGLDCGEGR